MPTPTSTSLRKPMRLPEGTTSRCPAVLYQKARQMWPYSPGQPRRLKQALQRSGCCFYVEQIILINGKNLNSSHFNISGAVAPLTECGRHLLLFCKATYWHFTGIRRPSSPGCRLCPREVEPEAVLHHPGGQQDFYMSSPDPGLWRRQTSWHDEASGSR